MGMPCVPHSLTGQLGQSRKGYGHPNSFAGLGLACVEAGFSGTRQGSKLSLGSSFQHIQVSYSSLGHRFCPTGHPEGPSNADTCSPRLWVTMIGASPHGPSMTSLTRPPRWVKLCLSLSFLGGTPSSQHKILLLCGLPGGAHTVTSRNEPEIWGH